MGPIFHLKIVKIILLTTKLSFTYGFSLTWCGKHTATTALSYILCNAFLNTVVFGVFLIVFQLHFIRENASPFFLSGI
jgi:hypothetical protein